MADHTDAWGVQRRAECDPALPLECDTPSVRRYPRTLYGCNGAFPRDPRYAQAFHGFERERLRFPWRTAGLLLALVLLVIVAR